MPALSPLVEIEGPDLAVRFKLQSREYLHTENDSFRVSVLDFWTAPDLRRLVGGRGDDGSRVGRESNIDDLSVMTKRGADRESRGSVPKVNRLVPRAGGDHESIVAKPDNLQTSILTKPRAE